MHLANLAREALSNALRHAQASQVTITLRGIGDVQGKVAWCTEGRIGIALDPLIDPEKVTKPRVSEIPPTA